MVQNTMTIFDLTLYLIYSISHFTATSNKIVYTFFLIIFSSAEQKKMELAEKYKQLKKSGKVEKYLMQKHKKNASKDRRHFPQSSGSSR